MSLDQYENFDDIRESTSPVTGQIFSNLDLDLLLYNINNVDLPKGLDDVKLEMHVYAPPPGTQYIGGVYDVRDITDKDTTLDVGLVKAFEELNIRRGQFKVAFNYLRNHIGDYYNRDLYVVEIAPDRDEIHLRFVDYEGQPTPIFTNELIARINDINKRFSINFGEDQLYRIINAKGDEDNIYLKIYGTFDETTIEEKQRVYLVEELIEPYIDNVNILPPAQADNLNTLRGPNWEVETNYGTVTETDFQTWNDLLGTNLSTSQQIIDRYFSGSLQGADLNIDFTNFENFVHYSSATERLLNFRYKLQLIEYYDTQIDVLSNANGSDSGSIVGNIALNRKRKDNVVGSFDLFERWLYNEPTSSLSTHGVSGSTIFAESYALQPWPKYLSNGAYVNHHTTSSLGIAWYTGYASSASLYDLSNNNSLTKTIPEHIRNDSNNSQYELFVNMIGQHFDILWTYVNALATNLYTREEHPKLGISSDLLKPMAESLGWQLTNGKQAEQLWQYKLGVNESGSYQSTGSLFSKSGESITHEVWRRIVNNLPYLLKSKGQSRGIKALMNAYGIPQTLLSIREYGGPKVANDTPALIEDRRVFGLEFTGSQQVFMPWQYITNSNIPGYSSHPWTQEIRFKPFKSSEQALISLDDNWSVTVERTGSYSGSADYGRVNFYIDGAGGIVSSSTPYAPIFDGDYWNLRLQTNVPSSDDSASDISVNNQAWIINCQKAADHAFGRITHRISSSISLETHPQMTGANSASYNQSWRKSSLNKLSIGGYSQLGVTSLFNGSIQEYRQYIEKISDDVFDLHTFNPTSYVGNNATSSFNTLVRHYVFGTDQNTFNHSVITSITSSHPDQSKLSFGTGMTTFATASGFANENNYSSEVETYYIDAPSLGGNNFRSQKIRLDDNRLVRVLSPENTAQRSRFENAPIDSERLGLFYSAADQFNKEIFNHIGPVELDDLIGDPDDQFETSYPDLTRFAQQYWKKYTDRNDINDYIRVFSLYDFSLFEQIKQLLPARAIPSMGLIVEPNVLERAKVKLNDKPIIEKPMYDALIDDKEPTSSADYILYSGSIQSVQSFEMDTVFHISASGYDDTPGNWAAEFSGSDPLAPMSYTLTEALFSTSSGYYNNDIIISPTSSIIDTPRPSSVFRQVERHYEPNNTFRFYPMDQYINGRAHDLSLNTEHSTGNKRVLNNLTGSPANQLDITAGNFHKWLLTTASNANWGNIWGLNPGFPGWMGIYAYALDDVRIQATAGPTQWLDLRFDTWSPFGGGVLDNGEGGYFTYNNRAAVDILDVFPLSGGGISSVPVDFNIKMIYATSSAELANRKSSGLYQADFSASLTGSIGTGYSDNFGRTGIFSGFTIVSGSRLSIPLGEFNQTKELYVSCQFQSPAGGIRLNQVRLSNVQVDPFPTEPVDFNFYSGKLTRVSASVGALHPAYNGREFVDIRNAQLPTTGNSGSFSISWLAQENVGHTNFQRVMFGGDDITQPRIEFTTANKLLISFDTPNFVDFPYAEFSPVIDRQSLNHYAISYDGGNFSGDQNIKLWVNGEFYGNGTFVGIPAGLNSPTFTLSNIGAGSAKETLGFAGLIGQVQVYDNLVFTQEEVERLWKYPHHRIIRDPFGQFSATNIAGNVVVSRSLEDAAYMDDFNTQTENLYFEGCRISSADINVPSTQTPDNTAVVEIFETNPNQVIYSQNARNGNLRIR